MGGIVVRPARREETDAVADVHAATARVAYAHVFEGPFPLEEARERWSAFPGEIAVAEEDGRLVGFAAYDARELYGLYVLPSHQGRGLGSRLLDAAGPVEELWVLRDNAAARRFYERRGWRAADERIDPYGAAEVRYLRGSRGAPRD